MPLPRRPKAARSRTAPPAPARSRRAHAPREHLEEFRRRRASANERVHAADHLGIKRFLALDHQAYLDGALSGKTKEMLGLVASLVLRCNDCVDYHLVQCVRAGYTDAEIHDGLNVALVVGGSIVIPHLRHAFETLATLREAGEFSL
ncbi:MAG TPA: carboxymuconolactone decarboxylase family protein [Candidatus Saccharimonadales bacterium]|nr:carboxymuconolactone decarboxylase family protein [Candidatus Saccharimonadales bacterium]